MLCPRCGKEVAETDACCGSCGSSLFVNRRALRKSQSTAGGAAPAEEYEQGPKGSSRVIVGLVLGVVGLLVVLSIVIPNLLRSRIVGNWASTAGTLRTINTAAVSNAEKYNRGFPPTLAVLGCPKDASSANFQPSDKAACFIDEILASGTKSCYRFSYIAGPVDSSGKTSTYTVHADPAEPCAQSKMHYFTDQTLVIRAEKDREAYASSPPIVE